MGKKRSLSQKRIQATIGIVSALVLLACLTVLLLNQDIITEHFGSYALVGLASGAIMFFLLSGLDRLDLRRFVQDRQDFGRAKDFVSTHGDIENTVPSAPLFATPRLLLIIAFLIINLDSRVLFQSFELVFLWTTGFLIGAAVVAHISSYRLFALRRRIQESNQITRLSMEQNREGSLINAS